MSPSQKGFQLAMNWQKIRNLFAKKREPQHLRTGRWGEKLAAKHLKEKRYRIRDRRVRLGKHDEIDIVAYRKNTLIFVEVKTRRNTNYGRPIKSIKSRKRHALRRAALKYLKKMRTLPDYVRFDVVEVVGEPGAEKPRIQHIENAFQFGKHQHIWW